MVLSGEKESDVVGVKVYKQQTRIDVKFRACCCSLLVAVKKPCSGDVFLESCHTSWAKM